MTSLALLAGACGGGGGTQGGTTGGSGGGTPVKGGTLNMLGVGDVDYMDPQAVYYTAGSMMLRTSYPDDDRVDSLLFSGDVLFQGSVGRTDLPGGDPATMLDTLRREVLPLPDAVVVLPGHGAQTSIGAERAHNPYLVDAADFVDRTRLIDLGYQDFYVTALIIGAVISAILGLWILLANIRSRAFSNRGILPADPEHGETIINVQRVSEAACASRAVARRVEA